MTTNEQPTSSPLPEPADSAAAAWVPGPEARTPRQDPTPDYAWMAESPSSPEPAPRVKRRPWLVPALAAGALSIGLAGGVLATGVVQAAGGPTSLASSVTSGPAVGGLPTSTEDDGAATDAGGADVQPGLPSTSSGSSLSGAAGLSAPTTD